METVVYGFQTSGGFDEEMGFAATEEACIITAAKTANSAIKLVETAAP